MKKAHEIAEACHEANRVYCESIGDDSQVAWSEAPEWQQNSAVNGVRKILDGLIATPEESHRSWLAEKTAEGWIYGEKKSVMKKQHPCMVPYCDLPEDQQEKDRIFFETVHSMMDV